MREPKDWTEQDLKALVDEGRKESSTLEYKSCPALDKKDSGKKTEVGKDVSAMANARGGTIVYGVIEKGHIPKAIDAGYDPQLITREWLEEVIGSNIQPKIEPLVHINQVELETSHPGKVAYVVCVPQSERRPHQAKDHKYYRRRNFKVEPMEDYEVRELMFRQQAPRLCLAGMDVRPHNPGLLREDKSLNFSLTPLIRNEGRVMAKYFALEARVPELLEGSWGNSPEGCDPEFRIEGETILRQDGEKPLFPSQSQRLHSFDVRLWVRAGQVKANPSMTIAIYADNMPPECVTYQLDESLVRKYIEDLGLTR